jgi:hypothetical protein
LEELEVGLQDGVVEDLARPNISLKATWDLESTSRLAQILQRCG